MVRAEPAATLFTEDPLPDEPRVEKVQKIRVQQHPSAGMAWFGGWLFTIGFLHLGFWKGALALLVWPYFLGVHLAR